jgi:hypothetical protein
MKRGADAGGLVTTRQSQKRGATFFLGVANCFLRLAALILLIGWACIPAQAQQDFGNTTGYAITTCGSPPVAYNPSSSTQARPGPFSVDANGNLCINLSAGGSIPAGTNDIGNVGGRQNVTPNDCSGTIAVGGTAQNAFAASATRRGFIVMNLSTDEMWISFTGAAAANGTGSYGLSPATATTPGGSFSSPLGFGINTALSIVAATNGDKFTCTWW